MLNYSKFLKNSRIMGRILKFFSALFLCLLGSAYGGIPQPWQKGFQTPASPMMAGIYKMHDFLLYLIFAIGIFVILLIIYVLYSFGEKRNPVPSKFTHNVLLEAVWTIIPVITVLSIMVPSVKLLFAMDKAQDSTMTIKAIGRQWYWTYEYMDEKDPSQNISFDSFVIEDAKLQPGQLRLLDVDEPLVVPVNTTVKVLLTASDVLHSFSVPALGIKTDCVPGRINETWFHIIKEGSYYGQCSELCGSKHGFMPISLKAVSPAEYAKWLQTKKTPAPKVPDAGNPASVPTSSKKGALTKKEPLPQKDKLTNTDQLVKKVVSEN